MGQLTEVEGFYRACAVKGSKVQYHRISSTRYGQEDDPLEEAGVGKEKVERRRKSLFWLARPSSP